LVSRLESIDWLFGIIQLIFLSVVFQLAHVVEETTNPNELGQMDNTWAIHQLFTTTNFAQETQL
jgi:linoleoyl-CoA desaturase